MKKEEENKFEKDIRFIASHYDPAKLDVDKAWGSFSAKRGIRKIFPIKSFLISAAAIVLLLIGFRIWFVWENKQPEWVIITAENQNIKHVTLPDQSFLVLAGGAEIRYDLKQFHKEKREIYLSGKASFDVQRDEVSPFIVLTSLSKVQVLGTKFELKDTGESVNIYVFNGKVSFCVDKGEKEVILTKDMSASYSTGQEIKVEEDEKPNRLSWESGELIFRNTPLFQVVKDLEEHYDVHILNLPAEDDLQLTASFSRLPLDDVLLIINQTLDIQLKPEHY